MGLIGTDVNWAQGNYARNAETIHRGIVVSVGYVPGLRVEVFPQPRCELCCNAKINVSFYSIQLLEIK
ncbi:hypothetical protein ACFX1X_039122 [Malus domestica]